VKFGPVPIDQATGKILGHNVPGPDGRRALRKGHPLAEGDIEVLRALDRRVVFVAELEPGDVEENQAASRVSEAVVGPGLELSAAVNGRVNFRATHLGVLRVDTIRLAFVNSIEGVTLASHQGDLPVQPRQIVATVKIIPYAIPGEQLDQLEGGAPDEAPAIRVEPLRPKKVSMIFSGSSESAQQLKNTFEGPLRDRVVGLGSSVESIAFVPLEDESGEAALAEIMVSMARAGTELIILAGETAIQDRFDIAPRAVERAGGRVECVGVPVDPGNLLMVAYLQEIPIMGAPGCARSRKTNVIDWVLPRLLVGEKLRKDDLIVLGNGGLLDDTPLRPQPRGDRE
jgi:molybdenum cofactor cytidylyltransferase